MTAEVLVSLERRADGVAVVHLDRPRANILSLAMLDQLAGVAAGLAADPPGAVVVWGGPRIFSAGADVADMVRPGPGGRPVADPRAAAEVAKAFARALGAVAAVPRAVVAAVSGYALGGGCELAMACDFRMAATNARLGLPEVGLGIIPGGGATQRLPGLVGPARAKEMILGGRQVDGAEALSIGLVERVCAPGEVLEAALAWAGELARGAVVAQGLAKLAVDGAAGGVTEEGLALERRLFEQAFGTEDAATGLASFLEDGPGRARFAGR